MSFQITMDTSNAAFTENDMCEVARILRDVATSLESGSENGKCRDINGNTVGTWQLKTE